MTTPQRLTEYLQAGTPTRRTLTAAAAPLALGDAGRLYLLAWLHADVLSGVPITEQSWRDAWGKAADYQTVVNARAVLAGVEL